MKQEEWGGGTGKKSGVFNNETAITSPNPEISTSILQRSSLPNLVKTCQCTQVLVVDDEPFNILCIQKLLKNYQLKSDQALDGYQAV